MSSKPRSPLFIGMPNSKDYIFDGHAGAGPSGAKRWMHCTASLGASRAFLETLTPNQQAALAEGSQAARLGTTAHAAAEVEALVALGEMDSSEADMILMELTVEPPDGEAYNDEMAEHITEYVDLVKQYHDAGYEVRVEQRVTAAIPLTEPLPDGTDVHELAGSADLTAVSLAEQTLVVGDLKYGDGVEVSVDENPQIREYALGVLGDLADEEGNLPDIRTVIYHIVQPRLGGIKTWTETLDDLLDWRDDVLSPSLTEALLGLEGGAKYAPSDESCQWCIAKGACPALIEHRMEVATELFDDIIESEYTGEVIEPELLDDEKLGRLYGQIIGLTKIADDLKAEVQRRLHRGREVPGFWLVNHSPARRWAEDFNAEAELDPEYTELVDKEVADLLWKKVLLSPVQALAILNQSGKDGDAILGEYIEKPDKVPLVNTGPNDRRKRWEGKPPEAMFPDLEE